MFDKSKLEAWLDSLIDAQETMCTPFTEDVRGIECLGGYLEKQIQLSCPNKELFVDLANALGVTSRFYVNKLDEYPITYWFKYKGYKIFSLWRENEI